jgi:hypothetical protein
MARDARCSGLPDGRSMFVPNFFSEDLGMEKFGLICGLLVHFVGTYLVCVMDIWYFCGRSVYFLVYCTLKL